MNPVEVVGWAVIGIATVIFILWLLYEVIPNTAGYALGYARGYRKGKGEK